VQLDDRPEYAAFRSRARDWICENAPHDEPSGHDQRALKAFYTDWQRRQFNGGWAGLSWPAEYGGRGLTPIEQIIWHEEIARANAPHSGVCFVGLSNVGPALIECGTPAQKERYLSSILDGSEVWCQGFSEPEAGSDLASLRCRGELRGDHFVINGQKIWTSYAGSADFQQLLIRTDPEAPRHHGISCIICPMDTPGVTVRPIETMAGDYDFCEVFYDDVEISVDNVIGEINGGWHVVAMTFAFERGTAFTPEQLALSRMVEQLLELAVTRRSPDLDVAAIDDQAIARDLARLRADVAALRSMTYMGMSRALRDGRPGPEGSYLRLAVGELMQRATRLAMDLLGPDSLLWTEPRRFSGQWTNDYLWSPSRTISGGTKDIQRNIIGERVLGLPRS
jgi:alkylation response protein AidB-like acyl-CoA dehydrogenase